MTKGEIIPFQSGDETGRFHRADGELPVSPQVHRTGEPEFFVPLGEPAFAVVLRLRSKFPRISVRTAAEGDKPPSS